MIRKKPFPHHPVIGRKEKKAVQKVLKSGRLSSFIASPGINFLGGEKIKEFEKLVADYHGVKYAVAFNSGTAALHAAVVACGIEPGDEVITTPYTFTSTATSILMHNAIPVFADVKGHTFNIDWVDIVKKITPLTKAIIVVHLFGNPCDMDALKKLCKKYELKLIEDCCQAPGATYANNKVGTIGDCGILSFTESKAITSGEGGMLITDNTKIATIARMVRNHGEILEKVRTYNPIILGYNYRMTEMDAAIGIEQFKKLDRINEQRIELARFLIEKVKKYDLISQFVSSDDKCVYYLVGFRYENTKMPREQFVKRLNAEGIPCGAGYIKPLYLSPIYQEHKPFIYKHYKGNVSYNKGTCYVAERLYEEEIITIPVCRPPATLADMVDIIKAIEKVLNG